MKKSSEWLINCLGDLIYMIIIITISIIILICCCVFIKAMVLIVVYSCAVVILSSTLLISIISGKITVVKLTKEKLIWHKWFHKRDVSWNIITIRIKHIEVGTLIKSDAIFIDSPCGSLMIKPRKKCLNMILAATDNPEITKTISEYLEQKANKKKK